MKINFFIFYYFLWSFLSTAFSLFTNEFANDLQQMPVVDRAGYCFVPVKAKPEGGSFWKSLTPPPCLQLVAI